MSDERLNKETIEKIFGNQDGVVWVADSPCENCGAEVIDHEWVDLDEFGTVTNCSFKPNELPYEEKLDESERTGY